MTITPTPITPQPEQQAAVKTWKPTTAGILTLIAGIFNLIAGIIFSAVGPMMWWMGWMGIGVSAFGIAAIVLGIISIIGGIFAIQRIKWGMGLAGAICVIPTPLIVMGILSIIFVALGKKEFS